MAHPRYVLTLIAAIAMQAVLVLGVSAQTVADFYKGKSITMAVGTSPGGDYDLRMRMVGRYLGKYIPGNPRSSPPPPAACRTAVPCTRSTRQRTPPWPSLFCPSSAPPLSPPALRPASARPALS